MLSKCCSLTTVCGLKQCLRHHSTDPVPSPVHRLPKHSNAETFGFGLTYYLRRHTATTYTFVASSIHSLTIANLRNFWRHFSKQPMHL